MRKIKFRGKRVDNGKWVYGGFKQFDEDDLFIIAKHGNVGDFNHEVIPETVGQFTGLTDKHGKEIFEGDILEFTNKWAWYGRKYAMLLIGATADEEVEIRKQYDAEPMERREVKIPDCYEWILSNEIQEYWTVIGDIHSNPELLENEKSVG